MRITKGRLEKVFQKSFKNRDGWKHISDYLVEHHTTGLDDARKIDVSADTAVGMAMGEALSRNYHTLKGVTIGVLGTGVTLLAINKISKRFRKKEVKVNLGEVVKALELSVEIEKEKLNN